MLEVHETPSSFIQIFEWQTKIFCLLKSFADVAQNSPSFQRSEKSPSIPDLWHAVSYDSSV